MFFLMACGEPHVIEQGDIDDPAKTETPVGHTTTDPPPTTEPTDPSDPIEGVCEPSGFCWAFPGGLGVYLHDPVPTSADTIWMLGEFHSVVRWHDGTWTRAYVDGWVNDLAAADDDEAWAVTDDTLYRIGLGGAEAFPLDEGFGSSVATDGAGTVWVAGPSGILEGDGTTWTILTEVGDGALYWLDGDLWAGDYGWARRWDGVEWAKFFGSDDLIDEIAQGPDGRTYLSSYTRGEVYVLEDHFVSLDGSRDLGVDLAPVTGGTWMAHDGASTASFVGLDGSVQTVDLPRSIYGLGHHDETAVGAGAPGSLLRLADGAVTDLNPGFDPPGSVNGFAGDSLDDLWAATDTGLIHHDGTTWTHHPTASMAADVAVHEDIVYAATWSGLVVIDGTVRTIALPDPHWGGSSVAVDADGTVFMATREGLLRLDGEVLVDTGVVTGGITRIDNGPAGLFAETDGRLLQYTEGGWSTLSLPSGMSPTDIDVTDRLWVLAVRSSDPALLAYDGNDWAEVSDLEGSRMGPGWQHLQTTPGLSPPEGSWPMLREIRCLCMALSPTSVPFGWDPMGPHTVRFTARWPFVDRLIAWTRVFRPRFCARRVFQTPFLRVWCRCDSRAEEKSALDRGGPGVWSGKRAKKGSESAWTRKKAV